MDEKTRRTITWVIIGGLVAAIVAFAISRKTELDRKAKIIGGVGSPIEQLEATRSLVEKQKLLEALEEEPRWVQQRAALAVARMGTYDGFWEAAGTVGVLDDPPQARIREAMRKHEQVAMDLLVEAIQDKDGNRRGACAGPLGQIGVPAIDPLSDLMDAWDDYVRIIVRDQLNAIVTARNTKVTSAETLIETRQDLKAYYQECLDKPDIIREDYPEDAEEMLAEADEMLPQMDDRIQKARDEFAEFPPLKEYLIIDRMLCDIVKQPPPSADQKQEAAKYLRRLGTAKNTITVSRIPVIPAVIDQLLTAGDTDVRATGCELLGTMGNQTHSVNGDVHGAPLAAAEAEKMVVPLLDKLKNDSEWTVRRKAAIALGRLQLVAMGQNATQPLIDALDDRRSEVKAAAAQALGMISAAREFDTVELKWTEGGPNATADKAAQPLAVALQTNRMGAATELAVALEKVGTPAIRHLLPALTHPEDEVRLLSTRAISRIGTDEAVQPLAQTSLSDPNVSVRQTAGAALRGMAETQATPGEHEALVAAIPALVKALEDDDWKVYNAAKDALADLEDAAVPQLVAALASPNPRVAYTVQQALADVGAPAVPPLVASLSSDNPQVVKWVSIALGEIGHEAIKPMAKVLSEGSSPSARAAAAKGLGGTRQADAVVPLLGAADDPSPIVRTAVGTALVKLGHPQATPILVKLLQDESTSVRVAVMERLFEWYDPPALAEFAKLLLTTDEDVQRRAAILLAEHVGGQEELRAAVASATTAGEAHDVAKATMKRVGDATEELAAGPDAESQRYLDDLINGPDKGSRYAAVVATATVARKTKTDQNRDWALGILDTVLAEPGPERDSDEWLGWQQFQQTAAVAIAQARVPAILEGAVDDATVAADVRAESVKALGLLGTDTSVNILIPLCKGGDVDDVLAAEAISRIGRRLSEESEGKAPEAKAAAVTLIDLAKAETDPAMRAKLGASIGLIGEAAVLPAIDYLTQAQDDEERAYAAGIIGMLGNVAVDPHLLRARGRLREVETPDERTKRDWITVAMYTTGDKMAQDFVDALPDDQEPTPEQIDAADAELQKLRDTL